MAYNSKPFYNTRAINNKHYKAGSNEFVNAGTKATRNAASVFLSIDGAVQGQYIVGNKLRKHIRALFKSLRSFSLTLLSGDNHSASLQMQKVFPPGSELLFNQAPLQKLDHIKLLQQQGSNVLMIGDGLNDAGALKQSDLGISVVEDVFSFTPACDAVMDVNKLWCLNRFITAANASKLLIQGLFFYSLLYNCIGLYYALSAQLQPMVAAILMPASSISVILLSFSGTKLIGRRMKMTPAKHDKDHVKI